MEFDIIIIGAGAAGLMAAWEMAQVGRSVAIIEARDRIGGRINTVTNRDFDMPVELGAEFIHGKLKVTIDLLKKAQILYEEVTGEIFKSEMGKLEKQDDFIEDYSDLHKKFKLLQKDISIAEFIDKYLQEKKFESLRFTLKNYIEGYYSADITKASTYALRDELSNSDNKQYRPKGGYLNAMSYLERMSKGKGVEFFLQNQVREIRWRPGNVEVVSDSREYKARKVLITVPMGVLQSEDIAFVPSPTNKINATRKLGFGPAIKTILQFESAFWNNGPNKDPKKPGFIFSKECIPTWWTQLPNKKSIITGWSGGPHAVDLQGLNKEEILTKGLVSLSNIFSIDIVHLRQQIKGWHVADWMNDPFSRGAYSYDVVDGYKYKEIIRTPEEETIYFAGEGLYNGPEIGTVEGALINGRETAHKIISDFKN